MENLNFYNVFYSCFQLVIPLLVAAIIGGLFAALFRLFTKLDDDVISFSFKLITVMLAVFLGWGFYTGHIQELAEVYWSQGMFY